MISKIIKDINLRKYRLCDAFPSEIVTAIMIASFALVIQLYLTSRHGTDEARMNKRLL